MSFRSNVPPEDYTGPPVSQGPPPQSQGEDGRGQTSQGDQSSRSNGYTPLAQSSPGDYHGGSRYGHALSSSGYSTNSSSCNNDVTPTNDQNNESFLSDDDATTIAGSYVVDDNDYKLGVSKDAIGVL